jgi:hypothetical protein
MERSVRDVGWEEKVYPDDGGDLAGRIELQAWRDLRHCK